jgi:mRNA interferase RelE/StbE
LEYIIEFKSTALKDLQKINSIDAKKLLAKILILKDGVKGDVKRLTNYTPEYRLRSGDYRVLFEVIETKIIIYRIKHRKDAYK